MTEILVSATLIASGVRALVVLSGLLVMFSFTNAAWEDRSFRLPPIS